MKELFHSLQLYQHGLCILILAFQENLYLIRSEDNIMTKPTRTGVHCKMKNLGIFYSEKDVFDILNLNRNHSVVSALIEAYQRKCVSLSSGLPTNEPRRPVIVVEGNYRPTRKLISRELARVLRGRHISVPPNCIREFWDLFDFSAELRRAYFGLSVYAAAHEARNVCQNEPVIISGYWAEQAVFAIAKEFELDTIPDAGHAIYSWPEDLLEPDVSFLLNLPQGHLDPYATTNFPFHFQEKRLKAFKRFQNPTLHEMKNIYNPETVVAQMQDKMLEIFSEPKWQNKNVKY